MWRVAGIEDVEIVALGDMRSDGGRLTLMREGTFWTSAQTTISHTRPIFVVSSLTRTTKSGPSTGSTSASFLFDSLLPNKFVMKIDLCVSPLALVIIICLNDGIPVGFSRILAVAPLFQLGLELCRAKDASASSPIVGLRSREEQHIYLAEKP